MMNDQLRAHVAEMAKILAIQDNHAMIVTRNDDGSALFETACINDTTMVQTLLSVSDAQSYINYTDVHGRTPIFQAASKGHTFIVSQLITARSNVHLATTVDAVTPLFVAAQNGHVVVATLIDTSCGVDLVCDDDGSTPLYATASDGHAGVVTQLIVSCSNVDITLTTNRATPILL